jgi:hypothetical protein
MCCMLQGTHNCWAERAQRCRGRRARRQPDSRSRKRGGGAVGNLMCRTEFGVVWRMIPPVRHPIRTMRARPGYTLPLATTSLSPSPVVSSSARPTTRSASRQGLIPPPSTAPSTYLPTHPHTCLVLVVESDVEPYRRKGARPRPGAGCYFHSGCRRREEAARVQGLWP